MTNGKLVRDLIPELIRKDGRDPQVRYLSGEALVTALRTKLCEEAQEAAEAGSRKQLVEELADVREVMFALMAAEGITEQEIIEVATVKVHHRGAFTLGAWLEDSSPLSPDTVPVQADSGESQVTAEELTPDQKTVFLEAFQVAFGSEKPGEAIAALYADFAERYGVRVDILRAIAQQDLIANRKQYKALRPNTGKLGHPVAGQTSSAADPGKTKEQKNNLVTCPICKQTVVGFKSGDPVDHEFNGQTCSGELATCKVCRRKLPVRSSDGRMTTHTSNGKKCDGSGRSPYEGRSPKFMQGITRVVSGGLSSTRKRH